MVSRSALTVTAGVMRRVHTKDLLGLGFSWGDPSDGTLRNQLSTEIFYRFQVTPNLALTPSAQWLADPAQNLDVDQIFVFGLRVRFTL